MTDRVLEIAVIEALEGKEEQLEAGVAAAVPLFKDAKGCLSMRFERSLERQRSYRLFVEWETLENHTLDFRQSDDFARWRSLISDSVAGPITVEHVRVAVAGF